MHLQQQQHACSSTRRACASRRIACGSTAKPSPISPPTSQAGPAPHLSTKPEVQIPSGFQAVYKGRAKGPMVPADVPVGNGTPTNGKTPSAARDQRPALSAIYPRGSVCAVVLGGGEADSRRLFPLTDKRTLPAIPVGASYRLIDVPISCLINSGVRKVFVLTQYNSTSLNRYLQHTYELHGGMPLVGDGFMEVVAATQGPKEQRWAEGAVDTVRQWWSLFKGNANERHIEDVLVLPSDQVYKIDFEQLVDFHRHELADLTIVCRPVEEKLVDHFGIVKLGAGTAVTSFEEKPQGELKTTMSMDFDDCHEFMNEAHLQSVPFLTAETEGTSRQPVWIGSCGIYLFRKEALDKLLKDNPQVKDFGRELIPLAIKSMKVVAYNHSDYFVDIGGSLAEYWDFNIKLAKNEIPFSFSDGPFYGARGHLPPNRLDGCKLKNVLLGTGCQITHSTIRNSVIGTRSIIGDGCTVEDTVMMGADYYSAEKEWSRQVSASYPDIGLGQGCMVKKAILDKNARIGNNVQLLNKEGVFESMDRVKQGVAVREGIIIVSKSAVLPDGTVV